VSRTLSRRTPNRRSDTLGGGWRHKSAREGAIRWINPFATHDSVKRAQDSHADSFPFPSILLNKLHRSKI
jgi:hypothetical protein